VALGDGQVDLEYTLQLGSYIGRTRTVLEANAGYRVRFNGPGHQALDHAHPVAGKVCEVDPAVGAHSENKHRIQQSYAR
jgi:hypothetical protein